MNYTALVRRSLVALLLVGGLVALMPESAFKDKIAVKTNYGTVSGVIDEEVHIFRGIPYAKAPVGDLRWQAPRAAEAWKGVFDATQNPMACIQGGEPGVASDTGEDCLSLTIWAPASEGPKPVMVWIHGGGFILGSGNEIVYSGMELAKQKDVVVVALNYRLSFMGFLALPQLSEESGYGGSGNLGLLDQVKALEWIQSEIAQFGGDPNNVTLFGESAGAISACMHLASPLSDGLFHKAILQSGHCDLFPPIALEQAEQNGLAFAERMGCANPDQALECLRAKPAEELLDAINVEYFELFTDEPQDWAYVPLINIDNYYAPAMPNDLIANGSKADIPIILGANTHEGSLFEILKDNPADQDGYESEVKRRYAQHADAVLSQYPLSNYANSGTALADMNTDMIFTCPNKILADTLTRAGHDVYFYEFNETVDSWFADFMEVASDDYAPRTGSFHSAEIPFVMGHASVLGELDTEQRQNTSRTMMSYWTTFAKAGDPNANGLPKWPQYSPETQLMKELSGEFKTSRLKAENVCDTWWHMTMDISQYCIRSTSCETGSS